MTINYNSAYRLYQILEKSKKHPDNMRVFDAWASIFDIHESQEKEVMFQIYHMLVAVRNEAKLLPSAIKNIPLDPTKYAPVFDSIDEAVNPALLHNTWNNVRQYLNDSVLAKLDVIADLLPSDSTFIPQDELQDHVSQLEILRTRVMESNLPEDVKRFLLHQIAILLNALRLYHITGVRSFHDALGELLSSSQQNKTAYNKATETQESNEILSGVLKIWTWFVSRGNEVDAMNALSDLANNMAGFVQRLLGDGQ